MCALANPIPLDLTLSRHLPPINACTVAVEDRPNAISYLRLMAAPPSQITRGWVDPDPPQLISEAAPDVEHLGHELKWREAIQIVVVGLDRATVVVGGGVGCWVLMQNAHLQFPSQGS